MASNKKKRKAVENISETREFFYAMAMLLKLYKAKIISRIVYEAAEQKCRERLCAQF